MAQELAKSIVEPQVGLEASLISTLGAYIITNTYILRVPYFSYSIIYPISTKLLRS